MKFNIHKVIAFIKNPVFPGSKEYWEKRYLSGGTSGHGSYGKLAEFKAEILNNFVKEKNINSVIEFGSGDGNQLSLFKFPKYIGLDVSKTAIKMCLKKFENDKTKSFFLYDSEYFRDNHGIFKAELALSLDVIYHLIEDKIFELYMNHLFSSAEKYVIIYSNNEEKVQLYHEKYRKFTDWIEKNIKGWKLVKIIKNKYPEQSHSDFFIYEKI